MATKIADALAGLLEGSIAMGAHGRVLVTGSAGHVGRAVSEELQRQGFSVRGLDLYESPYADESIIGNIQNVDDLDRAMDGVETVCHLAAMPDDHDEVVEKLFPANVTAIYEVFEAARRAGVKRIILASSVQVIWGERLTGPFPITTDRPVTPRYWYAATKVFMEAAAKAYAENHGIEMIAVRIGWCPRTLEQIEILEENSPFSKDFYLSYHDCGVFFADAVKATLPNPFLIAYATSIPLETERLDLTEAREILNYKPSHTYPEGLERVPGYTLSND